MSGAFLDLKPGAIFGADYRIVRQLAEGGMGTVYVADQLSTGKARALKVMRPELAADEELKRRFQQEARIGARIESEHVVEIHCAGIDEDTKAPFLVMELLTGEDLATHLERTEHMAPHAALELFDQLCHAIAAAHDAGIVHRDLKPENVFLARSKRASQTGLFDVKVLDFGIAKLVVESATRGATTVGMIGTPLWMAPEQTERGRITPAADVWALGLILFRVLTGCCYWRAGQDEEATYAQVLKEIVLGPLPAASARARELGRSDRWTPDLDVVFARSVTRDPMRRYQHARLFAAGVREVLGRYAPAVSSGRLAAAPPSAQVRAGADPASALDETAAGGPLALAPPPVPPVAPAPPMAMPVHAFGPRPPALLASSHGDPTELLGVPIRAIIAVGGVLFAMSSAVYMQCARSAAARREMEADREQPETILPAGYAPGAEGATARCRLCTTHVTVTGSLSRESVTSAVETSFPRLEAQCVRPGRRGAGTATFAFTVEDGRASSRRVQSSTSRGGVSDCLVRALGDVDFPRSGSADVAYTLRFDPNAP